MDEIDKIEETVDKVLSPERAFKWMVRIIVLIVVIGASAIVMRVAWHMTVKVDRAVDEIEAEQTPSSWFILKKDAIDASDLEIQAFRDALARHQAEVAERSGTFSVSHKSDRTESARLNRAIATAQNTRVALIREYNGRAVSAESSVLLGLPRHVELIEQQPEASGE